MQRNYQQTLKQGDKLTLKSVAAAAYGMENRVVEFICIQRRPNYKVGFLICRNASGDIGHFKPSDFK